MHLLTLVILCAGIGTRIWPLSRKSFPKQFVPLIDGKSLLQLTLERVGTNVLLKANGNVVNVSVEKIPICRCFIFL